MITHPYDFITTRGQNLNIGNRWIYSIGMFVISYYLIYILHRSIEHSINSKTIYTIRSSHGEFFKLIGSGIGTTCNQN